MKSVILSMVCLMALPLSTFAQTQIFYESFNANSGTGGNDDAWSGSIANNNSVKTDNEGWELTKAYGASQCLKFGASSSLGSAVTPAINGVKDTTWVSFRAGAWANDSKTLQISASSGTLEQTSVELGDAAWTTYTIKLIGASNGVKITFAAAQKSKNRFFLDDVTLTVDGEAAGSTDPSTDNPTTGDQTDEAVTASVKSISEWNELADGTIAQLYIADSENARVIAVEDDQATLKNDKGDVLIMRGFTKNPTMKVQQHVAGYIIGKKNFQDGLSVLDGIKKTSTYLLLIADPVTESNVETAILQIEAVSRSQQGYFFDLNGVNRGTNQALLPAGVYILNGNKITIK